MTTALHCSNLQFHIPIHVAASSRSSSLLFFRFPTLRRSLTQFRRPFTTNCSVADESTSASVAVSNSCQAAVKKKAADVSPELKGTSIFLVGMSSSIKTTLGKHLAEALRYYYFDSDSLVEEAASGVYAGQSFRETDEQGFRASETEVLRQLSSMGRLVVCAGNGAVQSSTNLSLLRHGISIWIDLPLDMVDGGTHISGPDSEVFTQLASLYEEMRGGYETADATVSLQKLAYQLGYEDLNAVTSEDMTLEVLKEIEKLTRVKKLMQEAARPF